MNIINSVKNLLIRKDEQSPLPPIENKSDTSPPSTAASTSPPTMADSITPAADILRRFSLLETERSSRRMEEEVQADEIRRVNRAQTATLFEENRRADAERQRQNAATEAERRKTLSKPKTWEEIHEPYITSVDRGNSVRVRAELPGVTKQLLLALIQRGGLEQLRLKISKAIAPHSCSWETAWNEKASLNCDVVRRTLRETIESNLAAIKAGNPEDIKPALDRNEVGKAYAPLRAALRDQMRASSNAARPHISAFATALQTAARDIAVDMVARERLLADEFSTPFQPSAWTRQIILCGFGLKSRIEQSFTGSGSSPGDVLFGLLDSRKP